MNKANKFILFLLVAFLLFSSFVFYVFFPYYHSLIKTQLYFNNEFEQPKYHTPYIYRDKNGDSLSYYFSQSSVVYIVNASPKVLQYEQDGAEITFSSSESTFPLKTIAYFSGQSFFIYRNGRFLEFQIY